MNLKNGGLFFLITILVVILVVQTTTLVKAFFDEKVGDYNIGNILSLTDSNSDEKITSEITKSQLYVVGDVMLARHVEFLLNKNGSDYPYQKIDFVNKKNSYLLGNFEGTIPSKHTKTPDFTFKFSIDTKHIQALSLAGFTNFSLANNHAFDFGEDSYTNTQEEIKKAGMLSFGHPTILSTSSVSFINLKNYRLAVVALHTLYGEPNTKTLNDVFAYAKNNSDYQIAYIHWGNEYKLNQSNNQRKFAQKLIFNGSDLIIGHHPHVAQGIEKIGDVYVFYSLGNFIFDQYFSDDVQQGLVLKISDNNGLNLMILPITSKYLTSQPQLMSAFEKTKYLNQLADRSSPELEKDIKSGKFTLTTTLATSLENAIMTP